MKRTTSVAVPATVGDQPLTVTYRVTVVLDAGGLPAARGENGVAGDTGRDGTRPFVATRVHAAWGYAEAVPVRVSSERQFDMIIDNGGER